MDTQFLQNFLDVVEYGSIAEVARKQCITPAAVNLRIKKIEEELGFKLLVRSGHTVKPTPEGAQVVTQAARVLQEMRNLKAASQGPIVFGHVAIGAYDSAMTSFIPSLMVRLIDRHPNLEVTLVKGYSMHLYSKVFDGQVDAAVILRPQFQLPKNLEWRHVRDEPLVVLAPPSNQEKDPNQLLRSNPLICYDRSLWGGQLAANYFRDHNINPKIRIEAASIELIASLVSKGLGVSLVPDCESDLLKYPALQKISLESSKYLRSVGLLWNRHSTRSALLEEIYKLAILPEVVPS
ncbi:MAG: LysR family transcriptional regulator [Betaproteobacteria bacterium HGW-Betaproteobacteria-16]|nr:MAG: LysR family transcriptional regulator [Betaproteobacteria bacterium HGW-Betaproteobacteria-16]